MEKGTVKVGCECFDSEHMAESEFPCTTEDHAISMEDEFTTCKWSQCNNRFEHLDLLVAHLSDAHVGRKKSSYICEWASCSRKGVALVSRFALLTHLRAHTGEKPFMCELPECDKSFSRSDALAKHMKNHQKPIHYPNSSSSLHNSAAGAKTDDMDQDDSETSSINLLPEKSSLSFKKKCLVAEAKIRYVSENNRCMLDELHDLKRKIKRFRVEKTILLDEILKHSL